MGTPWKYRKIIIKNILIFGLVLLLIISLSSLVFAEPLTTMNITVKDISTNEVLKGVPVIVKTTDIKTGESDATTESINNNGEFIYRLEPGNWRVELQIYDTKTEWLDYYGKRTIFIQDKEKEPQLDRTFYLIPIGTVEGVVKDEEGKLVQNAHIDFKCKFEDNIDMESRTDRYGSFKSILVPAGPCKIFAAFRDQVGVTKLVVEKGQVTNTTITLTQQSFVSQPFTAFWGLLVIGIFVAVIVVFSVVRSKLHNQFKEDLKKELKKVNDDKKDKKGTKETEDKKVKEEKAAHSHKKEAKQDKEELNPRARDIMETLNDREKKVVEFMLKHKTGTTQAKIRNGTGIPKTSLVRCFQALEGKKVIAIEKVGKMKKIGFTDWFMGKS